MLHLLTPLPPIVSFKFSFNFLSLFLFLYRYGQLIILLITQSKSYDIVTLHRDSALLRFLHGFLTSAPLATVQLYAVAVPLMITPTNISSSPYPISAGSLIASSFSLFLTLLSYVGSDRLHSDQRRVVIPGYIFTFLWHLFIIPARIFALVLFTLAHGPYIGIVVGVHWIGAVVWTLAERTNFCGDLSTTPPRKRYHFEIPFVLVVSFIFTFIFFNSRDGSTLARIIIYHLLTSVETLVISALFYASFPDLSYSPWAFAITMGLYLLGMAFMFLYYAAWHPNRTEDCFFIGCPRSCDCCYCFHKEGPHIGNVDLPLDGDGGERGEGERINREGTRIEVEREGGETEGRRTVDSQVSVSQVESPHHRIYSLSHLPSLTPTHNINHQSLPSSVFMDTRGLYGGGQCPHSPASKVGVAIPRGGSADNIRTQRHSSASQYRISESINIPQTTQLPREREENQFVRTKSERLLSKHRATPISSTSIPSPRQTPLALNHTHHTKRLRQSSLVNHPLPSPIGEEGEMSNSNRKLSAPPVIISTVIDERSKGTSSRLSTISSPSTCNATPITYLSPYSVRSSAQGRFYLEPTHTRRIPISYRGNHNMYSVPRPLSRHRSLSPETRSSEGSGCGHSRASPVSTRSTPVHSPAHHHRRRKKRSSNPLHSGDPMIEFTKLYTSPAHLSKASLRPSDDSDGGGVVSSCLTSSYVMSSDNKSDVGGASGCEVGVINIVSPRLSNGVNKGLTTRPFSTASLYTTCSGGTLV